MQKFDWDLVQAFLATAETGSFSAAARQLNLSQPTVGRQVQQLETQLGVKLLRPGPKGYQVTRAGSDLLEHAKAMQVSATKLSLVASGRAETIEGTVRITASELVATSLLPTILADLIAAEPKIQIELVATDSTENLLRREADIAVRMVTPIQLDIIARKLGQMEIGIFAAQSYLDRRGVPTSFEDLHDHVFLGFDKSDLIINGMKELGLSVRRDFFQFRVDDQVTYLEALKAGVGVGTMQVVLAEKAGLVQVLHSIEIPPLPVWLVAHEELRSAPRVRRVYDFLSDRLAQMLKQS